MAQIAHPAAARLLLRRAAAFRSERRSADRSPLMSRDPAKRALAAPDAIR
jgi:hypothetical protein